MNIRLQCNPAISDADMDFTRPWNRSEDDEPPIGAHLVTPRTAYWHHGLYVGNGKVVHYAGWSRAFHRGPIEEISLDEFASGRAIWITQYRRREFSGKEAVARARSRIGEARYRLLTNNCEHFCNWCISGHNRSYQADKLLFWPRMIHRGLTNASNCTRFYAAQSRKIKQALMPV